MVAGGLGPMPVTRHWLETRCTPSTSSGTGVHRGALSRGSGGLTSGPKHQRPAGVSTTPGGVSLAWSTTKDAFPPNSCLFSGPADGTFKGPTVAFAVAAGTTARCGPTAGAAFTD